MLERLPRVDPIVTSKGLAVAYTSVVKGNSFQTVHLCGAMSIAQARKAFYREHAKEVLSMYQQHLLNQLNPA